MANIKIEVEDRGVTDALNRLLAAGQDLDPILAALGRKLKENIQDGFQSGTAPDGRPWAPLKVRKGQPLIDRGGRGGLLGSIDYSIEGNSVVVGTNKPYAPVHQFGAKIEAKSGKVLRFFVEGRPVFVKRVTIPARPFLPEERLPHDWETDCLDAIANVIRRIIAGRGGPAS